MVVLIFSKQITGNPACYYASPNYESLKSIY